MTRRLLPYEYELIEALGVSKEEYLEFLGHQQIYKDIKEGTELDIRNIETVAIVLTVVGILFQVGAALLAPKPTAPQIQSASGQGQTRDQRFSPRFGFNSAQELAKYGDPIPLVYTDKSVNSSGGVRVAGSLLWSAVQSFGGSQFLQMMMLLAGHGVANIDANRSAFGQTSIRDLIAQSRWLYFISRYTGRLPFLYEANNSYTTDPSYRGNSFANAYSIYASPGLNTSATSYQGFSQVYSPSTSAAFGIYSPVPVNVNVYLRDTRGAKKNQLLGVTTADLQWSFNAPIAVNTNLTIKIDSTSEANLTGDTDIKKAARDARRSLASVFDNAGTFKLGSAKFKTISTFNSSPDDGDVIINLRCIEAGLAPTVAYNSVQVADVVASTKEGAEYRTLKKVADDLLALDMRNPAPALNTTLTAVNVGGVVTQMTNAQFDEYLFNPTGAGKPLTTASQNFRINGAADLSKSGQLWKYVLSYEGTGANRRIKTVTWSLVRLITATEKENLDKFVELEATLSAAKGDQLYRLKALTRYEIAAYSTISPSHIVEFSLKSQVFQRISGRQTSYGTAQGAGYPASDNGITYRTSMFVMRFKEASENSYTTVPGIFVVRRAAEQDNFNYIRFFQGFYAMNEVDAPRSWQFQFEPISDPQAEVRKSLSGLPNPVPYFYIENSGATQTISTGKTYTTPGRAYVPQVYFTGTIKGSGADFLPPLDSTPVSLNEWDLFSLDADTQVTSSFERGPEFAITSVTEQQMSTPGSGIVASQYTDLALIGFNVYSGRNLQDMRSFTAFVTQGKVCKRLATDYWLYGQIEYDGPTNFAPDIFYDTLVDRLNGIGAYADVNAVDMVQLGRSKKFCLANKLYMDGIIADTQNWREFWVQHAPHSLLEFARVNGRETLIPALPYDPNSGNITRNVTVSALFNQGNILEDSYKEEYIDYGSDTKDIVATVIYRALDSNSMFAVNKSVNVRRNDTDLNDAVYQTFDLSAFVTNEYQAILYGKLMCNIRRYTRRAIEFKTFPTISPVSPGDYIYVDIGQNEWDGIFTGVISSNNKLNMPMISATQTGAVGYKTMLVYRPGSTSLDTFSNVYIDGSESNYVAYGPNLTSYEGSMFVLGTEVRTKRAYRITEVQMDEEGEVTIRATEYPLNSSGQSQIADLFPFVVDR